MIPPYETCINKVSCTHLSQCDPETCDSFVPVLKPAPKDD
jgi:hypothetical protein